MTFSELTDLVKPSEDEILELFEDYGGLSLYKVNEMLSRIVDLGDAEYACKNLIDKSGLTPEDLFTEKELLDDLSDDAMFNYLQKQGYDFTQ